MATIQFRLRSSANKNVSIKVRISLELSKNRILLELNTGFTINPNDWDSNKQRPKLSSTKNRPTETKEAGEKFDDYQKFKQDLFGDLDKLESYLFKEQNKDLGQNVLIDSFWLKSKIIECFNRVEKTDTGILTNFIQEIIDNASTRKVKIKGGYKLGLSKSRENSFVSTNSIIKEYQTKKLKKQIHFIDIDENLIDKFTNWLLITKKYAVNTASKHIANIKTVSIEAERKGIQVNPYAKHIVIFTESDEDRFIQTLSLDELETIRKTDLTGEAYNNARKWILLGCEFGQRGGDLLEITKEKNIRNKGGYLYLDIIQQKTKKAVTVPIIKPYIVDIIENSFPYKISTQKLNFYIKKVCEIAKINAMTEGKIYDSKTERKELKFYEKYKLITTHCFRRSFATNNYKIYPTALLIAITGHSKESLFLSYINKPEDKDANADLFRKLYEDLNKDKPAQMEFVKDGTND